MPLFCCLRKQSKPNAESSGNSNSHDPIPSDNESTGDSNSNSNSHALLPYEARNDQQDGFQMPPPHEEGSSSSEFPNPTEKGGKYIYKLHKPAGILKKVVKVKVYDVGKGNKCFQVKGATSRRAEYHDGDSHMSFDDSERFQTSADVPENGDTGKLDISVDYRVITIVIPKKR